MPLEDPYRIRVTGETAFLIPKRAGYFFISNTVSKMLRLSMIRSNSGYSCLSSEVGKIFFNITNL